MVTPPAGCLSYALLAGDDTRAILKALGRRPPAFGAVRR